MKKLLLPCPRRAVLGLLGALAVAVGGSAPGLVPPARAGWNPAPAGPGAAASLPAGTLVFLSLPDPGRVLEKWPQTDLARLGAEPEVREFLAKPLASIPPLPPQAKVYLERLGQIQPYNLFAALTGLDDDGRRGHWIVGFQFHGPKEAVAALLADARKSFQAQHPAGQADQLPRGPDAIEVYRMTDRDRLLASCTHQGWYLLANDLDLLRQTLDRIDDPAKPGPSLAGSDDFKAVRAQLPADPETFAFVEARPLLDRLLKFIATAQGGSPFVLTDRERVLLQTTRALGLTSGFDGGQLRDALFMLVPGYREAAHLGALDLAPALPLTGANTVLFLAQVLDLPDEVQLPAPPPPPAPASPGEEAPAATDPYAGLRSTGRYLQDHGITLAAFKAAFQSQFSFGLDWPNNSFTPAALLALPVRDRAAAAKVYQSLLSLVPTAPNENFSLDQSPLEGASTCTVNLPKSPAVAPTLALGDTHLFLGLRRNDVRAALRRDKGALAGGGAPAPVSPPAPAPPAAGGGGGAAADSGLAGRPAYRQALTRVGKPELLLAFLDTGLLFERAYAVIQPILGISAAYAPQISAYLDPSKLPSPEVVSAHLTPAIMTERWTADGVLVESVGTLTLPQVFFGTTVLGSAAASSFYAPHRARPSPTPSGP